MFIDLTGANHWEAALADMYVDGSLDLNSNYRPVLTAKSSGDENALVRTKTDIPCPVSFRINHCKSFIAERRMDKI